MVDTASLIAAKMHHISGRSCFPLLEYDCIDWNNRTNTEGNEHSKGHCQLLVFHPVQVIHVFGMHVVWFIMTMSPHSLYPSWVESPLCCSKKKVIVLVSNTVTLTNINQNLTFWQFSHVEIGKVDKLSTQKKPQQSTGLNIVLNLNTITYNTFTSFIFVQFSNFTYSNLFKKPTNMSFQ